MIRGSSGVNAIYTNTKERCTKSNRYAAMYAIYTNTKERCTKSNRYAAMYAIYIII